MKHRGRPKVVLGLSLVLAALVALSCNVSVTTAQTQTDGGNPIPSLGYGGDAVRTIAEKLQCPVCEGTSVSDSPSQVAKDMRASIRRQLDAGWSEQEILRFFVDRYGPGVLREPPKTGFYSAVWWVPGIGILFGLLFLYGTLKKRKLPPKFPNPEPILAEGADLENFRQRVRDREHGD